MPDRLKELTPYIPPRGSRWEDPNPTRGQALRRASKGGGISRRHRQILSLLAEKPQCIHEIASLLTAQDSRLKTIFPHQISGRFCFLVDNKLIERTGATRPTPTGSPAAIYQLTLAGLAILQERNAGVPPASSPPDHFVDPNKMVPSNPLQTAPEPLTTDHWPLATDEINPGPTPAAAASRDGTQSLSPAADDGRLAEASPIPIPPPGSALG